MLNAVVTNDILECKSACCRMKQGLNGLMKSEIFDWMSGGKGKGMRIKTVFILLILCLLLAASTISCAAQNNEAPPPGATAPQEAVSHEIIKDTISPYPLHGGEYRLADLVLMGTHSRIFSFNASEDYQTVAIWCDVYRNGELVFTSLPLRHDISDVQETEGLIAVILERNTMRLNISRPGKGSYHVFDLGDSPVMEGSFWQDTTALPEAVDITDNKEIMLFAHASDVNNSFLPTPEHFLDNPDRINDYDYLLIVTCRFSE